MRKKGLRNISEQQLFLLIRYWANDRMYEDIPEPKTPAKATPKKAQASPAKKKVVEKDTPEKPSAKKRGPSKEERAAEISRLFESVISNALKMSGYLAHDNIGTASRPPRKGGKRKE